AYAPCIVETKIQDKPVKIAVETMYPFREEIAISVTTSEPLTFPLVLRLPEWTKSFEIKTPPGKAAFDGVEATTETGLGARRDRRPTERDVRIESRWTGSKTVRLNLVMPVRLYQGYRNAVAIERGPLVYALPIDAEWKKVKDRENLPFDDWEVYPRSPWNFALQIDRDHPEQSLVFDNRPLGAKPFSSDGAGVVAKLQGRRLSSWGLERGAAAPPPASPVTSQEPLEELTLIPYGCTDLRMDELPVLASP